MQRTSQLMRLASVATRTTSLTAAAVTRPAALTSSILAAPIRRLASSAAALAPRPQLQDLEEEGEEDPESGADDFSAERRTPFANVESAMHPSTYKAITKTSYKHIDMSPVQDAVLSLLPELVEPYQKGTKTQRDLLVRAKTGTGKTLAFLVPAIESRVKTLSAIGEQAVSSSGLSGDARAEKIVKEKAQAAHAMKNVGTLIISPTRELATQIADAALKLSKHHDFHIQLFVGGESKGLQLRDWGRGRKDILVATPGRLMDMMETDSSIKAALANVNTLVLDEADTLLDMGFRADIEGIIEQLPPPPVRQTFLFSATVSPAIRQIAQASLDKNFGYINCVNEDDSPVHAHIPQHFTALPSAGDQIGHVVRLIAQDQLLHPTSSKIILFSNTTKSTQLLTEVLRACRSALPDTHTDILEIHSKKSQDQRTRASDKFRRAKVGATVLVTSDVSARGVDYPDITRVIQVGAPASSTQYIHRVGRTGRGRNTDGRGDLVLLPFEKNFAKYCLAEVPIKATNVEDVQNQVTELADQYDSNPQAFARPGRTFEPSRGAFNRRFDNSRKPLPSAPAPAFGRNLRERIDNLDQSVKLGLQSVDKEAVSDAFSAMLGFYSPLKTDLRCRGADIMKGIQDWCREVYGEEPPYLSPQFQKKLGLVDGYDAEPRRGNRGMARGPRSSEWNARDSRRPSFRSSEDSGSGFKPRWSRDEDNSDGGYSSDRRGGGGFGKPRSYGDRGQGNTRSFGGGGRFGARGGGGFGAKKIGGWGTGGRSDKKESHDDNW